MKNWLVIHNDNIPKSLLKDFKEGQQDVLEFDITPALQMNENFSFDYETAEILKNHFSNKKKYDCIFIPYNLNKELYLDFSGLKVALHIRLSPELDHTFCPIVFYGYEDPLHVAKLSQYSKILFSIGSLTLTSSKISFENFNLTCDYLKEMTHEYYLNFLNELNIIPADDYKSHHSTANELALFQWSKYIGCDDQIAEVKVNRNRLYFKYLEAKRLFNADVGWVIEIDNKDSGPPPIKINGKIKEGIDKEGKIIYRLARVLLIDDEAKKGWDSFYANLFKHNPVQENRVVFESLKPRNKKGEEITFKTLDRVQIIEVALNKIKEFDPDIVLLDLRLQDDDFIQDVFPNDLTGIKIAQEINLINQGIQIIITSASNKIWNYEASEKTGLGVGGYIIKSNDETPEKTLENIFKLITQSILKAEFLKPVAKKIKKIKELFPPPETDEYENNLSFYNNSLMNLDVSFKLLNDSKVNKKFLLAGFSQLFYIIEDFVRRKDVFLSKLITERSYNNYVISNNKEVWVRSTDKSSISSYDPLKDIRFAYRIEDSVNTQNDLNFKLSAVLIYRFGHQCSYSPELPWISLRNTRNDISHGTKKNLEEEQIVKLLDFLLFILDDKKQSDVNMNKGFRNKSKA